MCKKCFRRFFIFFGVCFFLVSCSYQKTNISYIKLAGEAQGTSFSIIYADTLHRNYSVEVDSLFKIIDRSMSLWDTNSLISRINANIDSAITDIHFQKVFDRSMYISGKTGGAFDITVAPLVKRWGFHFKKNQQAPDSIEIKNILACVGWEKLKMLNGHLFKSDPCVQVDFNAIAQGYTVDVMAEFLESKNIHHYMVELGGEVRTLGVNESNEVWHIGIDKPIPDNNNDISDRPLQRIVSLSGKSLATSGNYRKYIIQDGKKINHTLDPFTGYPANHKLLSVSVKANTCMDADAYATAFMVMGLEKSLEKAEEWNLEIYCIYENAKGELAEAMIGLWY